MLPSLEVKSNGFTGPLPDISQWLVLSKGPRNSCLMVRGVAEEAAESLTLERVLLPTCVGPLVIIW